MIKDIFQIKIFALELSKLVINLRLNETIDCRTRTNFTAVWQMRIPCL